MSTLSSDLLKIRLKLFLRVTYFCVLPLYWYFCWWFLFLMQKKNYINIYTCIHCNHSGVGTFYYYWKQLNYEIVSKFFGGKFSYEHKHTDTRIQNVCYPSYKFFYWKVNLQNVITFLQHFIAAYFVALTNNKRRESKKNH